MQYENLLDHTKPCQLWKIMVITEQFIAELRVFKLILCQIDITANLGTRRLELAWIREF